jgi:NAD(P)-dependent dehydrogenase (short-subunit alcohol dehydrogenase family)
VTEKNWFEDCVAVSGYRTTIVNALRMQLNEASEHSTIKRIDVDWRNWYRFNVREVPIVHRYVLAAGVLSQRPILDQTGQEISESLEVNLINVVRFCTRMLDVNEYARICIVGSQSARSGSFDETYAIAKAGVEAFVRWKKVGPQQQLVCVSPPLIADSGMTRRRHDYPEVLERRPYCEAADVATAIRALLWDEKMTHNNAVVTVPPKSDKMDLQFYREG